MERPSGPNLAQMGLPGNPAQGRRAAFAAGINIPPPPPIPKTVRKIPSNSGLTASAPITQSQVIVLARDAMKKAVEENQSQVAEASAVSSELKPGVTVNLSHKNIQKLPEEVVDVIKDQLERLALSHNKISSFPARFAECTLLRYLNVRNNRISEFPLPLCDLKSLEILDLGRNQLRNLPPDIARLTSLKVFAVQKNLIKELPLCLADMGSLQMIKLDGNPIVFPPKEILQAQASSPPNDGFLKETEVKELTVTIAIKKFLRQHANDRMEAEAAAAGEDSSEGVETPRLAPIKRPASGRFPIKRRRESKHIDPVLEAAKGILYSVFQIHPMIQMLMHLTSDGTSKRSSLEIVFYNTNVHVEELEQEIQRHEVAIETVDSGYKENESVQRACITLVNAYAHVCSLLATNVDLFIENGDPRYIRTLLMLLYNSIMELRVTVSNPSPDAGFRRAASRAAMGDTIRPQPHSRESSVTPTADRPGHGLRSRSGNFVHNPSNLRVATDVPLNPLQVPYINGTGRTATVTPTPRSGESWASTSSRGVNGDFTEEDRVFERIYLSLQRSTDWIMRSLPSLNSQFGACLDNAIAHSTPKVVQYWRALILKCNTAIQNTETLKKRLSLIKLKEPGIRTHSAFWALCTNFIDAWAELGKMIKHITNGVPEVQLPNDTRQRLRPVQHSIKETRDLIRASPWSDSLRAHNHSSSTSSSLGGSFSQSQVPAAQSQLPMTPQSAALGPAVQATVATPQSASFAKAFNGGVFERADALISMGGRSMHGSRTGTMSSAGSSSLNSITSMSSNDELMTPNTAVSPGPGSYGGQLPFRLGNGSRVAL
ncbi:putative ram signaling pathway protein [Diaporthe ampelina]|uniref:Putative ram signaling pathway protein n=1 Tax=Diaporthe ampelina TaxID=1214573 RepID=A0A0G2F7I3_9PEZI|nr:putative ram signaling pathway protein [Diaporthe ampelina]